MRRTFVGVILLFFLLKVNAESRSTRNLKPGCTALNKISGHLIPLPLGQGAEFTRPWLRTDLEAKLWENKDVTYNWAWMKTLNVRGLNATLEDFLTILEAKKCLFIPYGEAVKDLLLGPLTSSTSIFKLEGESTCSIDKVYELCKEAYGAESCGAKPTKPSDRVTIGRMKNKDMFDTPMVDSIAIAEWNSTFPISKAKWEFTANAVGLLDNMIGRAYIIDLSGNGVRDVCTRKIVLPVGVENFDKWSENNLVKVMRYYNLRAGDKYVPVDGLEKHVIEEVQRIYSTAKFQEYYCRFVYGGVFVPTYDPYSISDLNAVEVLFPQCQYVKPDSQSSKMIGSINSTLEKHFGGFWHSRMFPDLQSLKFIKVGDSVSLAKASGQASWPRYETTTERAKEVPVSIDNRIVKDASEEEDEIEYVDCDDNAASALSISLFITIFCAIIFII